MPVHDCYRLGLWPRYDVSVLGAPGYKGSSRVAEVTVSLLSGRAATFQAEHESTVAELKERAGRELQSPG